MRRRSKPKVVWLPTTNAFSVTGDRSTWQFASGPIDGGVPGDASSFEIPLVQDGVQSGPLDATASLADIESSGYRLRRIVGKIYVLIAQHVGNGASLFGVTAGLIIRRTDPGTGGSLAANIGTEEINPADIENSMDPWIWRRSWLLGDNGTVTPTAFSTAPANNFGAQYPGALEGPHVDQKTARIVGPEERLFLDINATTIVTGGGETSLIVITDLRVLASMRANVGNRRNASR